jgi:AcrR family transcriptional regulator
MDSVSGGQPNGFSTSAQSVLAGAATGTVTWKRIRPTSRSVPSGTCTEWYITSVPRARPTATRRRLVEAATEFLRTRGVGDLSLRELAAGIGTSHRMLLYHFGSKDGLLVEVARDVEQRQREALTALAAEFDGENAEELTRRFWQRLRAPDLAGLERLFFELYGRGLHGGADAARLLEGVVDSWVETAAPLLEAAGLSAAEARTQARLGVAVGRGLLLDVLATGEEQAVDDAYELYLTALARFTPRPAGRERPGSA